MLEPYFMHLYKVQHDAILMRIIQLVFILSKKEYTKSRLFWRKKLSLGIHLYLDHLHNHIFKFETDLNFK